MRLMSCPLCLLQVLAILEGKVVVGHSLHNDFAVLDVVHPGHMIRDTSSNWLLSQLAGFPRSHHPSLKILASRLLERKIQVRAVSLFPVVWTSCV